MFHLCFEERYSLHELTGITDVDADERTNESVELASRLDIGLIIIKKLIMSPQGEGSVLPSGSQEPQGFLGDQDWKLFKKVNKFKELQYP